MSGTRKTKFPRVISDLRSARAITKVGAAKNGRYFIRLDFK